MFVVEGVEAAVNLLAYLLSGTTMAFHACESDVRLEAINILPLIGCNVRHLIGLDTTKNG